MRISDRREFKNFIRRTENAVPSPNLRNAPYKSLLVANATMLLIDTAVFFLKRQIEGKAKTFLNNGGFSERMDRMRRQSRGGA